MQSRVHTLFAEVLEVPIDRISDQTSPENTPQWDSLRAMNLVLAQEETFEIWLSTKEIVSMRYSAIVRKMLAGKGVSDA